MTAQTQTEPAQLSYEMSPEDSQLVSLAAQTFTDDYRYLLDMVTNAGKAERATLQAQETFETSPQTPGFYAEAMQAADGISTDLDGAS